MTVLRKRGYKIFLFILFPLFLSLGTTVCEAQRPIRKRTAVRMPYNRKMKIICPIFVPNEYPYQGIGVKVGDPFAVTYKLYASKFLAMEIAAGQGASFMYKKFYKSNFSNFPGLDTLNYLSHSVKTDFVGQFRLMFHAEIKSIDGLDVYLGGGYQFKNTKILYKYNDPVNGFSMEEETTRSQFFNGPEVFLGLERANFSIPVSIFVEANTFFMLEANGLGPRFQAVVGIRYIF